MRWQSGWSHIFGHDLADTPPIVMRQLGALKRFDAKASLAELKGIPTLVMSAAGGCNLSAAAAARHWQTVSPEHVMLNWTERRTA